MKKIFPNGYTIIELLVVLAVILIATAFVMSGFRNYARYQEYNQSVTTVRAVLQDAHLKARSSEGGQAHGIKILGGSLVVFPGTTYSAGNSANNTTAFANVTLVPSFPGGVSQVNFANLTGLPSATGTIQIIGIGHIATTTIEITGTGGIQ
jgi:prepilin-type N-terminal cleavage/methylation domain-containing protein